MSRARAPKALNDEELTELLSKVLEETLGKKIDPKEMQMIIGIAKEMIKEMSKDGPAITKDDLKYRKDDVSALVGKTLVAATATAMHITHHKNELKQLLQQHKELTQDLKNNPNQPDKAKKQAELKGLKLKINETLDKLNRLDPNQERREEFDNQKGKSDPSDDLDKVKSPQATPGAAPTAGTDALTQSLINLYGRDPRVAGSVGNAGPEQGNEMGIPTLCVLTGLPDNLEKDDNALPNSLEYFDKQQANNESREPAALDALTDSLSATADFAGIDEKASNVIDDNPGLSYSSPSPSPGG